MQTLCITAMSALGHRTENPFALCLPVLLVVSAVCGCVAVCCRMVLGSAENVIMGD